MRYSDIYSYDIELYGFIKQKYGTGEDAWKLFYESYIDPDCYPSEQGKKIINNIKCSFDSLLSISRIHYYEGFGESFIETFKTYRKNPVFSFPSEKGGINTSRALYLEDRIDHTLLDIKNYCEGEKSVLYKAYTKKKTSEWIAYFNSDFEKIVNWLGINGVFVNDKYEVLDLEKEEDIPLKALNQEYSKIRDKNYIGAWGDASAYYKNVKNKLDIMNSRTQI